jgi:hypothetical protein
MPEGEYDLFDIIGTPHQEIIDDDGFTTLLTDKNITLIGVDTVKDAIEFFNGNTVKTIPEASQGMWSIDEVIIKVGNKKHHFGYFIRKKNIIIAAISLHDPLSAHFFIDVIQFISGREVYLYHLKTGQILKTYIK